MSKSNNEGVNSKSGEELERFGICVPASTKKMIDDLAKIQMRNRSSMVNVIVVEYFKGMQKKKQSGK